MCWTPVMSEMYTMADSTAPSFAAAYPKAGAPQAANSKTVQFLVQADETGTAYYVVVADNAQAPSPLQVMAGQDGSGLPVRSGNDTVDANVEKSFVTAALAADDTAYDVYVVVKDAAGNASTPAKVGVVTPAAAFSATQVTYTAANTLRITFNMDIDRTSAEDPLNYMLSTIDIMVPTPPYPDSAVYVSATEVDLTLGSWFNDLAPGDFVNLSVTGVKNTDNQEIVSANTQYVLTIG